MKQQLPVGSDIARRLLYCNSILRFGVQRKYYVNIFLNKFFKKKIYTLLLKKLIFIYF